MRAFLLALAMLLAISSLYAQQQDSLGYADTTKLQFRYAIYSDVEGLQENNPNGLIQQEMYFSWPLINRPILKFKNKANYETAHLYFMRNAVIPNLQINKLEQKQKFLPLLKNNGRFYVNTFDLIQYATLTNYVKLNLFTLGFRQQSRIYWDVMLNHILTKTVDSSSALYDKYNVNSLGFGTHLRYQSHQDAFINLTAEISWFSLHLLNTEFKQFEGPRYELISKQLAPFDTVFKKNNSQWRLQAEVTLNFAKLGKQATDSLNNNLIFIRTYLYTEKLPLFKSLSGINNNIFMFQIGYRKSLDDVRALFTKKQEEVNREP